MPGIGPELRSRRVTAAPLASGTAVARVGRARERGRGRGRRVVVGRDGRQAGGRGGRRNASPLSCASRGRCLRRGVRACARSGIGRRASVNGSWRFPSRLGAVSYRRRPSSTSRWASVAGWRSADVQDGRHGRQAPSASVNCRSQRRPGHGRCGIAPAFRRPPASAFSFSARQNAPPDRRPTAAPCVGDRVKQEKRGSRPAPRASHHTQRAESEPSLSKQQQPHRARPPFVEEEPTVAA